MSVDRNPADAHAAATNVKSTSAAEAKRRRNSLASVKSLIPVFDDNKKVETGSKKAAVSDTSKTKDKAQARKSVASSRSVRSRLSSKNAPKPRVSSSRPSPTPLSKQSLQKAFDNEARSRNKTTDENSGAK